MIEHPAPYRLIIFDVDGTLRRCTVPNQVCPNNSGEWELCDGVVDVLKLYNWTHTNLGIVSNQGGVSLGYLTMQKANTLIRECVRRAFGSVVYSLRVCFHNPDEECACRKPSPYMLLDIVHHYHGRTNDQIKLSETLYVGDMKSDQEAARRAGVAFYWNTEFFGLRVEK